MRKFTISTLIPLEDFPRDYSLRFLTQIWRNFGTFDVLDDINGGVPPYVYTFGEKHYLDDGHHRCLFRLINGIDEIMAVEEFCNPDRQMSTLTTVRSVKAQGVNTMSDLFMRVKNPSLYLANGPITHKITLEELRTPGYYLRI